MDDCLFCKIASGDIPSDKIYEDEKTFAFLDINPVNEGHTLVIPKKHARDIFEIEDNEWTCIAETVKKLSAPIERAMGANGVNLIMNNKSNAGQLVEHAHVHIIPRQEEDGLKGWPQHPYKEGVAEKVQERIISEL